MIENLDLFVKGAFGEPAGIDGMEVWGVFDENYEPMFNDAMMASGKNITFLVKSSDIVSVSHSSIVNLRNRVFEVVMSKFIDDGKFTTLVLKEKTSNRSLNN